MNCFEHAIATPGTANTAFACCAYCGAGLCLEHAHLITLPALPPPGLVVRTTSGARRILCPSCYAIARPADTERLAPSHGRLPRKAHLGAAELNESARLEDHAAGADVRY